MFPRATFRPKLNSNEVRYWTRNTIARQSLLLLPSVYLLYKHSHLLLKKQNCDDEVQGREVVDWHFDVMKKIRQNWCASAQVSTFSDVCTDISADVSWDTHDMIFKQNRTYARPLSTPWPSSWLQWACGNIKRSSISFWVELILNLLHLTLLTPAFIHQNI
jgi:hypothetical protein